MSDKSALLEPINPREIEDRWLAQDVLTFARDYVYEHDNELTLTPSLYRYLQLAEAWEEDYVRRVARAGLRVGLFAFTVESDSPNAYARVLLTGRIGDYTPERIIAELRSEEQR